MLRLSEHRVRPRLGRILGRVAGALLFTIALCQSDLAYAGPLLGMYPIETAIVNACHSGQGGTGDIAILTAANRLQLMPFAPNRDPHRSRDHRHIDDNPARATRLASLAAVTLSGAIPFLWFSGPPTLLFGSL
jgi:hypothetical protein